MEKDSQTSSMKAGAGNYFVQAWLVIVLALLFGLALAGVHSALSPRIAANKLQETLAEVPRLVPGAVKAERETVGGIPVYRALDKDGAVAGWVLPASGQGFSDRIELLVGLDATAGRITGLYVLDQKETPGLGNRISEEGWRAQFRGKSTGKPLVVTKGGAGGESEIQAVTGATISSESVVGIVNRAVTAFRAALKASGE